MITTFEIYGISISLLSLIFLFILIRLKGVFDWKISLAKRIKALKKESSLKNGSEKEAYLYVYSECRKLYQKLYFGKPEIIDLRDFINNIAAIYYPDKKKPIFEISLGSFLYFSNLFAKRFEEILQRKGFKIISELRLKNLYFGFDIYTTFKNNKVIKSLMIIWEKYTFLKLILYLNPIGLLFFLSSNLVRMSVLKFIITDCYLFAGVYAIKAYGDDKKIDKHFIEVKENKKREVSLKKEVFNNKELKKIRNEFLKNSLLIGSIPEVEKWKKAVLDSAELISENYFPESRESLKEAKIGLIVERSAFWLAFLSELKDKKIVKYFFNIKISSITFAIDLKDKFTPSFFKNDNKIFKKSLSIASYTRTIYKIYKTPTPIGVASWAGGEYGKNVLIFFIIKTAFEKMVCETDTIYKNSI